MFAAVAYLIFCAACTLLAFQRHPIYGFYFYLTWMPTYLERVRGFSSTKLGVLAGAPMVACMIADVTGGHQ